MTLTKILVVEDEKKLARVLQLELEYENYQPTIVYDGRAALDKLQNETFDLILLDIMLPELSGLEVVRHLRKKDPTTPVILLTARDAVHDKVSGLDLGANDYITKPFQIEELLARMRVQLRKKIEVNRDNKLIIDKLVIDRTTREVFYDSNAIELTKREFDLLDYLATNHNQALSREQLLNHVWGYAYIGETNVVDVYIRYLRIKIDKAFNQSFIHTVRGIGYMLKEPQS
ncbi:response regulator transcription factor [Paraliobacillus sediminis]|uniref:response regulator transcription factor n=1 Tax=Paraliobacillus sediminis TaxID=1885916 RepID=UPI000E3CE12A|nr:response regulator transcription factor [Paraliobacillus sediminis]